MQTEKGSTLIGTIALIAIAILVGIWIGAKTDIVNTEIEEASIVPQIQKTVEKGVDMVKEAKQEVTEKVSGETKTEEKTS